VSSLAQRVVTAVVLLAVLLAAIFLLSPQRLALALVAVVLPAGYEWGRLCGLGGTYALVYALLTGAAAFVAGSSAAVASLAEMPSPAVLLCGVAALFWALVATPWVIGRWPARPRSMLLAVGALVLASATAALVLLHARSPWVLLAAMAAVFIADTAAFFAGRRFGRRKLAPAVSPGKTWEGVGGALVAVALYAIVCAHLAAGSGAARPIALWIAAGLVLTAFAIVGDLFESWLKREAGVKDSGRLLPGHGGVLDRIDALLAAMPPAALAAGVLLR
jgi:phosphatidate cytidylyltransferase